MNDKKPDIEMKQFKGLNLPKEWVNPPTLDDLKKDLNRALPKHSSHMAKVQEWIKYYNAERLPKEKHRGKSCYVDKTCRKLAEWVIPKLTEPFLSNNNLFKLIPTGANDQESAKINSLVINQQFANQLNSQKFIDDLVRSTVVTGTGVVFVGWDYQEGERVREEPQQELVPIQDPQQAQEIVQIIQQAQQDPSILEKLPPELMQIIQISIEVGQPVMIINSGTRKIKETYPRVNQPYLEVCNLEDIIFDPDCKGNLAKSDFIIRKYASTLSELKNSGNYPILDDPKFNAEELRDIDSNNYYYNPSNKARNKFTVYEYWGYWDYKNEGIVQPIIATWAGNKLLRLEANPYPEGILPFATCAYTPVIGDIYGEPDTEIIKNNQDLVSALMRASIDTVAKSAGGQTAMPKGALDPTNLKRFIMGDNFEYNPNIQNPLQAIVQMQFPQISPSLFNLIQYVSTDAENLTGVRPFSQSADGGNPLGNTSLSAKAISDSIVQRSNATLRRVAKCVTTVARFIVMLNQQYLTEDFIVQVSENENYRVNPEDLAGTFDYTTTVETVEAKNNRLSGIMTMLQTVGNQFGEEPIKQLTADLFELWNEKELADKLRKYTPPPPSQEQQMAQQLELQKLQAELALMQADIQLKQAQAQGEMAKAQLVPHKVPNEQAKAQGSMAKAEMAKMKAEQTKLDIQRTISGQKHAEKLEEIEASKSKGSDWISEARAIYDNLGEEFDSDLALDLAKQDLFGNQLDQYQAGLAAQNAPYNNPYLQPDTSGDIEQLAQEQKQNPQFSNLGEVNAGSTNVF